MFINNLIKKCGVEIIFLNDVINVFMTRSDFFAELTLQHIEISLIAIILSIVIGLGLGIFISIYQKNKWILSLINIIYTIPSIALFALMIPITGIGDLSAIIALIAYGLLPMVRNTYAGITNIDPLLIEAAEGMGSTRKQLLLKIRLPLAVPHIMAGLRNMVVMVIAFTGIAAFIGAGGLGVAIYRGISLNNMPLTVAGCILIAILALGADFILGRVEKFVSYDNTNKKSKRIKLFFSNFSKIIKNLSKKSKLSIVAVILILIIAGGAYEFSESQNTVHIAARSFTEQEIMGNMLKEMIEQDTNVNVDLKTGFQGVTTVQPAMEKGEVDICMEYTGTGWNAVLHRNESYNESMFQTLEKEYKDKYNFDWENMYGFENTYGIAVSNDVADKYDLKTYSDLAEVSPDLTLGAESEFYGLPDGWPGLSEEYGFNFKDTKDVDRGLLYNAANNDEVDAIVIYTTDGQLEDANVTVLEDDKDFFPSYQCGNVIREDTLKAHPELQGVFDKLNNIISQEDMIKMDYEVEVEKKSPSQVAHQFLVEKGLVKG